MTKLSRAQKNSSSVGSQKLGQGHDSTEDGQTKTQLKEIKLVNGQNGIGISLISDWTEVKSDVPIEFATAGIGAG